MIMFEHININNSNKVAVLGAVDNESGHTIAEKMRKWLEPVYDLHIIWHDGSRFEQPALRYAQEHSKQSGEPVLYLHTRGAYNVHKTTGPVHRMWEEQFGKNSKKYFDIVRTDKPTVACPFTGNKKITWYNGFVANAAAWGALAPLEPNTDRHSYERMFMGSDVNVVGVLATGDDKKQEDSVLTARKILFEKYN